MLQETTDTYGLYFGIKVLLDALILIHKTIFEMVLELLYVSSIKQSVSIYCLTDFMNFIE